MVLEYQNESKEYFMPNGSPPRLKSTKQIEDVRGLSQGDVYRDFTCAIHEQML